MSIWLWMAIVALAGVLASGYLVKRKLARLGRHLPAAMEWWEEEVKNIEKPKG